MTDLKTKRGADLRRGKRQAIIQDSKNRKLDMAPRQKKPERDTSTYAARVSLALEQQRVKRGWTVEDLQTALKAAGVSVPMSSLYAYEVGKANKGVDVPVNLYPAIAQAFGYKSAAGWLPAE